MAWSWRYEAADGTAVKGPAEAFGSQADAESWLGQTWRQLAEDGISLVVLVEGDRVEYRMSLLPAGDR
jgi:hypothetical protein